jgi:glycosyltransferase involved in cell wall biosynthesis
MYRGKKVGVVVPAYNEELLINRVLDNMPDYVDRIYVIDDYSTDNTSKVVRGYLDSRIVLTRSGYCYRLSAGSSRLRRYCCSYGRR